MGKQTQSVEFIPLSVIVYAILYVQRAYEQQKQQEEARSGGGFPGGFGGAPGGGFGGGAGGGFPGGFGGGAGGGFPGAGGAQPDMSKLFKVRLQGLSCKPFKIV